MTNSSDSAKPKLKKSGLVFYVLMVAALGCIIYGIYGWATGKW